MTGKCSAPAVFALALTLLFRAALAGDAPAEVLANSDIIGMTRAQIAPAVVIAKINASANIFDLSSRGLMSLKSSGVSDDVIAAMLAAGGVTAPVALTGSADDARFRQELEHLAGLPGERSAAAMAWMVANRDAALPSLRRALTDSRPEFRAAAAVALGELRDRDSVAAIRTLLVSPAPEARRAAARSLFALGDTQSVNAAEQALSRPVAPLDGYIRLVGHAKLTRTAATLGQILSVNPDAANRAAAAWALGEIGRAATAGRPALERALETDADAEVRREAASAIAKFHDPDSARLLMNACRRDPEVRKITLRAMAEYPETVEFLVSVMNLGADQIAADELDAARASLYRLTGQDFALDGQRWASWFAANRAQYDAVAASDPLLSLPGLPGLNAIPETTPLPQPQVDLEAWSIVADSTDIPMAPQVDDRAPARPGTMPGMPGLTAGVPPLPGAAGVTSIPSVPTALSPNDFDAVGTSLPGFAPVATESIPAMDLSVGGSTPVLPMPPSLSTPTPTAAASESAEPSSILRTWSSDPRRVQPTDEERPARDFSAFPRYPGAPAASGAGDAALESNDFAAPDVLSEAAAQPEPARLPTSPIVTPMATGSAAATDDDNPLRGLSLPIPGMERQAEETVQAAADEWDSFATEAEDVFQTITSIPPASTTPAAPPAPITPPGGMDGTVSGWEDVTGAATLAPIDGGDAFYDPAAEQDALYGELFSGTDGIDDWGADTLQPFDEAISPADGSARMDELFVDPFAAPDSFAPAVADETIPAAPLPPVDETAVVPPAAPEEISPSVIFVEPEPGQLVVDDGYAVGEATPAPTIVYQEPGAAAAPTPEEAYIDPYGDDPTNYPPPNPDFITTDPNFTPPPTRQYTEPYRPPEPPQPEPEAEPYPGYDESVFHDTSVPLPPVRPEGTIVPPSGKELPPMLGEGFFK